MQGIDTTRAGTPRSPSRAAAASATPTSAPVANNDGALGYRIDGSVGFSDWIARVPGRLSLYYQNLEAVYSAPGQTAATDRQQYGGTLDVPITDEVAFGGIFAKLWVLRVDAGWRYMQIKAEKDGMVVKDNWNGPYLGLALVL